jgi:hypothetical protein
MAKTYPEFDPPESYIIPEGISEGESFEDIATFKVKTGGKICLTKIGDAALMDKKGPAAEPDDFGTEAGMSNRVSEAYKNRG